MGAPPLPPLPSVPVVNSWSAKLRSSKIVLRAASLGSQLEPVHIITSRHSSGGGGWLQGEELGQAMLPDSVVGTAM
jgi:hypothetical protein